MSKNIIYSSLSFFLILCFIIFFERHLPSTDELIKSKNLIFPSYFQDLRKVSFNNITIKRKSDNYQIEGARKLPAVKKITEELFRVLSNLKSINILRDNIKPLSYYGLDKPLIKLVLTDILRSKTLLIGKNAEGDSLQECYAKVDNSSDIYVISASILKALEQPVSFYTESHPFEFVNHGDVFIKWEEKDDEIIFTREDDLFFIRNNNGLVWQGNQEKGSAFFRILSAFLIEPENILTDEEYKNQEFEPLLKIWLKGKRGSTVNNLSFTINSKIEEKDNYLLIFNAYDIKMKIDASLVNLFKNSFFDLAASTMFEGPVANLKRVDFNFHNEKQVFQFFGEKMNWQMNHKYYWLFNSSKIFSYILKYVIQNSSDLQKRELEKPVISIDFTYEGQSSRVFKSEIFDYTDIDGNFYLQHNGHNTSAIIDPGLLNKLSSDPFIFTTKTPFNALLDRSTGLLIRDIDGNSSSFKKSVLGKWSLLEGGSIPQVTKDFIKDLQNAKCSSACRARKGVDFGFTSPIWELEFEDDKQEVFFKIKVGSFSKYAETFLLGNDEMFLFFKDFFLLQDNKEVVGTQINADLQDNKEVVGTQINADFQDNKEVVGTQINADLQD